MRATLRKIRRTLVDFSVPVGVVALLLQTASTSADPRATAIGTVRKLATGCESCFFFALPTKNPLVKKHSLFFVSTLDRIPPPFWTVALPKKGGPLVLDARKLTAWNRMVAEEKPKLKTDADLEAYVKAYLDLASGRSVFIPELLPAELERVRKKVKEASRTSPQIMRQKEVLSVSFYAKDAAGTLALWDLLLEPTGEILKSDVQEF